MKILFFGSSGWIGKQFCEYLIQNNIVYLETNVRADNEKDVENEIININPTHIISFIGRTHGENYNTIDYLEQPGKLVDNIRDNLYAPIVLSILCKKYNIHYTYMGTGCIFNYNNIHEDVLISTILGHFKVKYVNPDTDYSWGLIIDNETSDSFPNFIYYTTYGEIKQFDWRHNTLHWRIKNGNDRNLDLEYFKMLEHFINSREL